MRKLIALICMLLLSGCWEAMELNDISLVSECSQSLTSNSTYVKMNELVSQMVRNEIMGTIQYVQKAYKADIFGFGEEMYRQEYKRFKKIKNWDEEFARAHVIVSVETNLVRSGMRTDSFTHFKQ